MQDYQNSSNIEDSSSEDEQKRYFQSNKDETDFIKKDNNFINKEENKILQIDRKIIDSNIIINKYKESKGEEIDQNENKNSRLALNTNTIPLTCHQKQKMKEENNNSLNKEKLIENNENKKSGKFSFYNMSQKIKNFVLIHLREFINEKIQKIYNNIGYGINLKKLFKQKKSKKSTIESNREFIKKKFETFFLMKSAIYILIMVKIKI